MSGPFDAYEPVPLPRGRAEPPPPKPGFGEVFSASRTLQRADNSDYQDRLDEKAYAPVVDAINAFRRQRGESARYNTPNLGISATTDMRGMNNAYGAANAARIDRDASIGEIWSEIGRIRAVDPGFLKNLPASHAEYWKQVIAREQAERAQARETLGRSNGVARGLTSFAGGVVEGLKDPTNIYTLPFGGFGKTIGMRILTEGFANGGIELLTQPQVARNRELLGESLTGAEARENVAGAFVGGAAFQGVGEGVAAGYKRLFGQHATPDERAAIQVIEREEDVDATSPFDAEGNGPAQHRRKLGAKMDQLVDETPVKQRRVSRETLRRPTGTVLDNGVVSFFREKGYPEAQARGIAAGIAAESRNNHGIVNPDSGAFGLGQWLGSRKAELIRRYGANPTREQQLEFLHHELQGGDHGGRHVLAASDEAGALDAYIRKFMRPAAGAETTGDLRRGLDALGRQGEDFVPNGDELAAISRSDPEYEAMLRADIDADPVPIRAGDAPSAELDLPEPPLRRDQFESDAQWRLAQSAPAAESLIDPEGIVFHGTNREFDQFEPRPAMRMIDGSPQEVTPQAYFFSDNRETAATFAADRARIDAELRGVGPGAPRVSAHRLEIDQPLDLVIDDYALADLHDAGLSHWMNMDAPNPLRAEEIEDLTGWRIDDWQDVQKMLDDPEAVAQLRQFGFDGVRLKEDDGSTSWAVFDPSQIRPVETLSPAEIDAASSLLARYSDPASAEIAASAEGLTHDVKAGIEAGELDEGLKFDTGDTESDAASILDALDGDDAAIAAIEACL